MPKITPTKVILLALIILSIYLILPSKEPNPIKPVKQNPSNPTVIPENLKKSIVTPILDDDIETLDKIRKMTKHAWNSYMTYAKGDDELKPLSKGGKNWTTYSYLFTPVDSLDTLFIMGLDKEYKQAKKLVLSRLNFDIDPDDREKHNLFETNIRVLGGLLAAYELDPDGEYLKLAVNIGDRIILAFGNHVMPPLFFNIRTGKASAGNAILASAGTLQLELQYLSDITKNPIYAKKALNIFDYFQEQKLDIPGLYPIGLDTTMGFTKPFKYGISYDADSFYEYLLKLWISTGGTV